MHRFLVAGLSLALMACGGGDDFTVDVEQPAARAFGQLSSLDGGMVRQILALPTPQRTTPGEGEVLYTIPASGGYEDATLAFRVEPVGDNRSRVHVNVEMPSVKARIGGIEKMLSEPRVEAELRRRMEKWADGMKSGDGHSRVLQINEMLGGLALAVNPDRIDQAMAMAHKPDILAEFLSDRAAWESGPSEHAAADAPMSDPTRDAEAGDDPSDQAIGADPSPGTSDFSYQDY